jgi:hypothetical protein
MQYAPINHPVLNEAPAKYPRSRWTRQRANHKLRRIATAPLDELRNGPHDPWSRVMVKGMWQPVFTPNPVWIEAVREYDRRIDLYERNVPLAQWGVA